MQANRKDLASAAVFALIGGFFAFSALRNLRIGSAVNMGPGYIPLAIAVILLGLAAFIALRSFVNRSTPFGVWPWRGVILILGAPVIFCFTINGLGLGPTTFLVSFVTAFASTKMTPLYAFLLALGIAVFCVAVFVWGIAMPVPVFGEWVPILGGA